MKKLVLTLTLIISIASNAQRIQFTYDPLTGNQTERVICSNCSAKTTQVKDEKDLKEEDYIKNEISETVSYYPNPVKDVLYLKWNNTDDAALDKIEMYSANGQLLRSIENLKEILNTTLSFYEQPQGMYLVSFYYTDGRQESVKIVKQ